ncbi:MAG: hypothetical protein PWP65_2049 [Clostridia bacterium]|nr:hypothetical protein [Clostridia bacterium]
MQIDARGMHYRQLNELVRQAADAGETHFELINVNGQRYIGSGIHQKITIEIKGVPGNDLASFMDGPEKIVVWGNGQDAIGNTMNSGTVVVHGSAGDVIGYGMRGGQIFIRGDVGYRVGIHMKEYRRQVPVLVIGGTAGDFLGEYMAGGMMFLLGLNCRDGQPLAGDYLGTGMHGGVIYLRGKVDPFYLGKEVAIRELDEQDENNIATYVGRFCREFGLDYDEVRRKEFCKLIPVSSRPYGRLYVY